MIRDDPGRKKTHRICSMLKVVFSLVLWNNQQWQGNWVCLLDGLEKQKKLTKWWSNRWFSTVESRMSKNMNICWTCFLDTLSPMQAVQIQNLGQQPPEPQQESYPQAPKNKNKFVSQTVVHSSWRFWISCLNSIPWKIHGTFTVYLPAIIYHQQTSTVNIWVNIPMNHYFHLYINGVFFVDGKIIDPRRFR